MKVELSDVISALSELSFLLDNQVLIIRHVICLDAKRRTADALHRIDEQSSKHEAYYSKRIRGMHES